MPVQVPIDDFPSRSAGDLPPGAGECTHRARSVNLVSVVSGAIVCLTAGAHLVAWLDGAMADRGGRIITMKANTAVCLLLLGGALVLLVPVSTHRPRRWVARSCASLAALIGALTFGENLFGWNLGLDQLLATEAPGAMGMVSPNRMGSPASFSVVTIGIALLLLSRERARGFRWEQGLALGACFVGLLTTTGYLYGVQWLYGLERVSAIAWPTALLILALGVGVLAARPSEGLLAQVIARDPGGTVVRRLLIPVVLLPIVLGWVEVAGLRWRWYEPAMGTALLTLTFVVTLFALTWVTGRRGSRAAAELGAQREFLAVTLNSIGDAVIACDGLGRVTFVNPVGVALTGWKPEEAIAQAIHRIVRIVDERTGQPAQDIVGLVLQEGHVVALANHAVLIRKDGSRIPIEDSVAPIRDAMGALSGAVLVFHDVAEKRRAQEALRESEMRFRLALRNAPVSVAAQDRDLRYIWAFNQRTAPPDGIIGLRDDQIFTPEEAEHITAAKQRVLDEGVELREQLWLARPTGRIFLDVCWEPLRDEAGQVVGVASATVDLTLRKLAEDALRFSEEKFAKAFRGNTSAMTITRLRDGVFIDVNDRYLQTTGLPRQDLVGKSSHELRVWKHAEDRDTFVRRLSEDGEVHNNEYAFLKRDGTEWTGLVSSQVSELEGEPVIISSIVDITERKRAEEALRDSEERLKAALASMTDAVFISDAGGRFVDFNEAFATFHRFPDRQACAKTLAEYPAFLDVFLPDGTLAPLDQWAVPRALRGETATNAEYTLRRKDTGEVWVGSYSFAPIRTARGDIVGSVVVGRDVTDRRLQERRVQELSRLYAVLSKVNEAIVRTGDPLTLYGEVCRIVAEDGQRPLAWIGLVEGRAVKPVAAAGQASDYVRGLTVEIDGEFGRGPTGTCIREGRPVVNDNFDVNPATKPWRNAARAHGLRASAAFPLRHQGAVIGAVTLYGSDPGTFDQEQVRLLEALSADVSYALDKMWQEQALRDSAQNLREADRHKDEFLAMLSHELRNPLAPIRSAICILERAAPGTEQATRAQAVLDRQVAHLTRLVDDLLDVTRISRGKIHLRREPIDFAEVVRRVVEDHRSGFAAANLDLVVDIEQGPIQICADATRVAQVIGNLLHNALKFTPPGGSVKVSVEADGQVGQVIARVRDDGTGIEADMLPRIFEPFTQAATALDRSRGGLGLGLALVKGLVELHQGQVGASSQGPGTGAEFIVRLPLDSTAHAPRARPCTVPPRSWRVLVIEDNIDAAESLQLMLELGGHEVRVAHDGPEGLRTARAFMPRVVLCDIGLPGMDGFDVARAFRADPSLSGVFLVALSGYAQPDDVQRAMEAGFHRHLAKPAAPEVVERMLVEMAEAALGN